MKKKNDILPITSPAMIKIIGQELRVMHEDYYFVFSIIVETGYPLGRLLDCRVQDLKGKSELTFRTAKRYNNDRTAPLSEQLKKELDVFFENRDDHEYAFRSRYTGEQLHFGTYKQTLRSVSNTLGIDPPVTVSALERTYKYNQYINKPDPLCGNGTRKNHEKLAAYFGANEPKSKGQIISATLKITRKNINDAFKQIVELTKHPSNNEKTYAATLKLLASVDTAVEKYLEVLTQESQV